MNPLGRCFPSCQAGVGLAPALLVAERPACLTTCRSLSVRGVFHSHARPRATSWTHLVTSLCPSEQPVHVGFGLPCFPAGKDEGDQLDKILSIMGQPTEASMPVRPAGAAARWRGRLGQRLCSNSEEASTLRTTATAASRCVGLAKHQVRHCPGHAAGLHNVGPLQHGAAQPVPCAVPPQSSEHMLLLCWRCRRVSQRRWLVSVPWQLGAYKPSLPASLLCSTASRGA